jgi:hypothetical protein
MRGRVTANLAERREEIAGLPHQLLSGEGSGLTAVYSSLIGTVGAVSPERC